MNSCVPVLPLHEGEFMPSNNTSVRAGTQDFQRHGVRVPLPRLEFSDPLWPPPSRLPCDPAVEQYCRYTGPILGGTARQVLKEIGRYVNPETGKACPSMDRLADDLELSKSTISRAVRTLHLAELVEVEKFPSKNGYVYFEYTFSAGLARGWSPAPRPERGQLSMLDYRLKIIVDQQRELDELRARLAGLSGEVDPGESTDLVPSEWNEVPEEEDSVSFSDFVESSSSSEYVPLANDNDWLPDLSEHALEPIEVRARAALAAYEGIHKWRSVEAAVDAYLKDSDRLDNDIRDWEQQRSRTKPQRSESTTPAGRPECIKCGVPTAQSRLGVSPDGTTALWCASCYGAWAREDGRDLDQLMKIRREGRAAVEELVR